ncbi:hypothetical protein KFL_008600010, partial [Klebsormidium nitens]
GSLSVEENARQFDSLCAELGLEGPSENDKIVRFKSGLHPKMQTRVVAQHDGKRWTNYRDLVAYASMVWSHVGPTLDAAGPGVVAKAVGGPSPTFRRDKRKHDNPNAPCQQGPKGAGGQGLSKKHRQAVKHNGLPKAKRVLPDAYRQKLLKEGKCLNCEEKDHFARECPNPPKEVPQGF